MENTWKLTKKTSKATYEAKDLTAEEVIEELPTLVLYAKHGAVRSVYRELLGCAMCAVKILCDFEGDEVEYIFEREVKET